MSMRSASSSIGKRDEAIAVLEDTLKRHPGDRESLMALINFARAGGDSKTALRYAETLAEIEPDNEPLAGLIQQLRAEIAGSPGN